MRMYRQIEGLGQAKHFDKARMEKEKLPGGWWSGWEPADPAWTFGLPVHSILRQLHAPLVDTQAPLDNYLKKYKMFKEGFYDTKLDWWKTPGSILTGGSALSLPGLSVIKGIKTKGKSLSTNKIMELYANPYTVSIWDAIQEELIETVPGYIKEASQREEHLQWDERYYSTPFKWEWSRRKSDNRTPRKKLKEPYGFARAFEFIDLIRNMEITTQEVTAVVEESLRKTEKGRTLLFNMTYNGWWPTVKDVSDLIIAQLDTLRRNPMAPEAGGLSPTEARELMEPYWKEHPEYRPVEQPAEHESGQIYITSYYKALSKWRAQTFQFLREFGGTAENPDGGFLELDSKLRDQFLKEEREGKTAPEALFHKNISILMEEAKIHSIAAELFRQGNELIRSLNSQRNAVPDKLQGTIVNVGGNANKLGKYWVPPTEISKEISTILNKGIAWAPEMGALAGKAWIGQYPIKGIADRYVNAVHILQNMKAQEKPEEETNVLPLLAAGGAAALLLLL